MLDEFRSSCDVPGLSAAVLLGERDPWAGAAGGADPERDRPMTPATQFAIGSMTKSFVAALVLRLIEGKHLTRHDPIASYLPTGIDSNGATVEDVLAHRSGIREHVTPRFVKELLREPSRAWTPAEVLRHQEGPAGSRGRSAYSSTNYILLGMVIEHISGAPLGTSMRELLLDPLRLDRVIYQGTEAPPTPRATGLTHLAGEVPVAIRDTSGLLPCRSVATAAGAAGGLAADAESLARWAFLLYGGAAILQPEGQRVHMGGDNHAFGSTRFELDGEQAVGHPGRIPGYRGAFAYLPSLEMSCAVLINTDAQDAEPVELLTRLVRACRSSCHGHPREGEA